VAATDAGTRLTERHRTAQVALRTQLVRDLLRIWPTFDAADITSSWAKLEPVLVALIQARFPMSASLAATYLPEFRRAEGVAGGIVAAIPDAPLADLIVPNLRYVGPMNAHRLTNLGRPVAEVARITVVNVEGELTRQVLAGGRQTLVEAVRRDRKARGYSRVTDGSPCHFCAMLAGRGAVYKSEASGSFDAHRKCGCTGELIYFTDAPLSSSAQRWSSMYDEAAAAVPSNSPDWSAEVRREFRRRYTAATATN